MGGWGLFFLAAVGVVCGEKLRLPREERPNVTGHSQGPTEGTSPSDGRGSPAGVDRTEPETDGRFSVTSFSGSMCCLEGHGGTFLFYMNRRGRLVRRKYLVL